MPTLNANTPHAARRNAQAPSNGCGNGRRHPSVAGPSRQATPAEWAAYEAARARMMRSPAVQARQMMDRALGMFGMQSPGGASVNLGHGFAVGQTLQRNLGLGM